MASEPEVLFETRGRAGIVTLNRPAALNALTLAMVRRIHPQLAAWATDPGVHRVVIRAAGERAFCAGGDIRQLYDWGRAGDPRFLAFYREEYLLNAFIKSYPKPYVALVDGIVMGGGVGVSVHGSHRVATERTVFAMPETGIGLFPDVGGTFFLPRCPGETGMYLGLTGSRLKAADCLYAGIATHYVPHDRLDELTRRLCSGDSVEASLAAVAGEPAEPGSLAMHRGVIDRHFLRHSVEDILASLDGEPGEWAARTAAAMRSKSPTSLKICFRQLRAGLTLDFAGCMRLEYRIVNRIPLGHDFFEGIRAVVVDKDQRPAWRPASLAEVSAAAVDAYFAPLAEELPV